MTPLDSLLAQATNPTARTVGEALVRIVRGRGVPPLNSPASDELRRACTVMIDGLDEQPDNAAPVYAQLGAIALAVVGDALARRKSK